MPALGSGVPYGGSVLALGNTASVMAGLATCLDGLFVAYPTNALSVVLQANEKCSPAPSLNYPLSVSCFRFVREAARSFSFFHSELGYAPACRAAGVPYGVHLHGVTDVDLLYPRSIVGSELKMRYREAVRDASYVVCHPAVLNLARAIRPDASALPLPVDTAQFNPGAIPREFEGDFSIFSPSRMDQWKGHDTIWTALSRMRNSDRVTVYQSDWGWEPRYGQLKRTAPHNVRFIPLVPRPLMASHYTGASLVLGQMQIGDFGMTELEAAACGAPVLTYQRDESTPFLPKSNDATALAAALDRMVEDPTFRRSYAKRCSEYVLQNFGLSKIASEFSEVKRRFPAESTRAGANLTGLYAGTGFELVGRLMGERRFSQLKASLIGL